MRPTLIVMAKAPRLGFGKSRLAREIGAVEALRINRGMHARVLRAACDLRWRTVLAVTPLGALDVRLPGVWPPRRSVARIAQARGDLGARIAAAVEGAPGPVCVIGCDAPGVTRADLACAFASLRQARAVIGLAHDGGFWLAGARSGRVLAAAARGRVRWSSADAGADMAAALPLPIACLPSQIDVDDLASLRLWRAHCAAWRDSSGA